MAKYLTDIKHCHRIQAIKQFLTTQLRKKEREGETCHRFCHKPSNKKSEETFQYLALNCLP